MTANGTPFRVVYSEQVRETIKKLAVRAVETGQEAALSRSLKYIDKRLHSDPLVFGEPLYRLKHTGLLVRRGGFEMVYVRYAVDPVRFLVYVQHVAASSSFET